MENDGLPDSLPGLDIKAGLSRMGGGRIAYARLLAKFETNNANAAAHIGGFLSKNDFTGAQRLAHTLAGVSGNIGADRLHRAALRLEAALRERNAAQSGACLAEVGACLSAVSASIRRFAASARDDEAGAEEEGGLDIEKAEMLLKELKRSIEDSNAGSMSVFVQLKKSLRGSPVSVKLEPLEKCLAGYDFDGALREVIILMSELKI